MNLSLIPSLFFFFGLLSFVYAAALHYYLRHTDPRVVLHWSLGALVWGVAVTLTVFRTELPLLLSYFLANAIAFSANIELNRALWVMGQDDRSSPVRRHLDPFYFLTYLGLLYAIEWYVPAEWRSVGKTGFVSIVMVVLSLEGARYCFRVSGKYALELGRYFGYLYLIVAGLWGGRVAVAVVGQGVNAFDPTPLNTAIFLTIFVTGIMKYLMFPMLLLKKSENEKQEQLKKTLAKVNRTVTSGALSASIAHELNQPLASIRINGQVLRKILANQNVESIALDQGELKIIVDEILSENERAAKIIESLRAIFSQGRDSRIEVDLAHLIQKLLDQAKPELEKGGIKLEVDLAENLSVVVPEDEFRQVIMNMLFNSMQALNEVHDSRQKIISIRTWAEGRNGVMDISDNGPGVPKEIEDLLFNILTTSKDSGMGLGLWLCKYIIERHDGSIAHALARLGGATFVIRLPQARPQPIGTGALA